MLMSDIEILRKPLYRPVKKRFHESRNPSVQLKSKDSTKTSVNTDLSKNGKSNWWCEDVW